MQSWRGLGGRAVDLASDLFDSLHKLQELCQGEDIRDKGCEVGPKCPRSCHVCSWQLSPALSAFQSPQCVRGRGGMAAAPLAVARIPRDSSWKCHWSPASPSAATKTLEVSVRGGTWPPAQLGNGLGVISAASRSKKWPFRAGACV